MGVLETPPVPANPTDYQNRYTSVQACEASGISATTLKNWVSRKPPAVLMTEAERASFGRGQIMLLSFNRIMQIALTAELVGLGFQPRSAAIAAAAFTDVVVGPIEDLSDPEADIGLPRMPGELFPTGWTYLVVSRDASDDRRAPADCINVTEDTPAHLLLRGGIAGYHNAASVVVVDVNAVHRRVRAVLGA